MKVHNRFFVLQENYMTTLGISLAVAAGICILSSVVAVVLIKKEFFGSEAK